MSITLVEYIFILPEIKMFRHSPKRMLSLILCLYNNVRVVNVLVRNFSQIVALSIKNGKQKLSLKGAATACACGVKAILPCSRSKMSTGLHHNPSNFRLSTT